MQDISALLSSLGLDQDDSKTYILLLETGPIAAGKLAKKLGVARSSLYGFLKRLVEKGLVVESQRGGIKQFAAEHPDKIDKLFNERVEQLQKDQQTYQSMLPELRSQRAQKLLNPRLQLFEGADGLKHVLKDMLLYSNLETQAFWPIQKMIDILGTDFFRYLNKVRIKSNLYTRTIWPSDQIIDIKKHPYMGAGPDFKREIRIAPKDMHFTMGYWIYGSKVVFVSSRKESFGFIIESAELTDMLKAQFELLWAASSPLSVDPQDAQPFIDELERYT